MKYHGLRAHWIVHLGRVVGHHPCVRRDPWHTHLYRAWQSWRGHPRYTPAADSTPAPGSIPVRPPHRAGRLSSSETGVRAGVATFERARRDSGI